MRLELKDAYRHLHLTRNNIFNFSNTISDILPTYTENEFFKYLDHINNSYFSESNTQKIE